MQTPTVQAPSDAHVALRRAREYLLTLQDDAGWWQGELQTNVTMDAEDMFLREFLGIRRSEETERSAAWIRSQQREDGTWANFYGGPGELSTTIEAYWALRLAGDGPDLEHMRAAAAFVRAHGGLERARVFTHVWLALFGLWSWEEVPALVPELVLLPRSVPLNVYDFACWARQTIVALSLVKAHRPVRPLPFRLEELLAGTGGEEAAGRHGSSHGGPRESTPEGSGDSTPGGSGGPRPDDRIAPSSRPASWQGRLLTVLDRVLRAYERHPFAPLRRLALVRAERWIVRRQEADGSWGGIQPPWVYSLMALHLAGYPLDHPVMKRGLEGLDRFMVEDTDDERRVGAPPGVSRRLEACQSPVWDTALAIVALADAGLPDDDPALVRAAKWLLGEEVTFAGDWRVARPDLAPAGWAFEFANVNYPDVDDTAEVVLALQRVGGKGARTAPARGHDSPGPPPGTDGQRSAATGGRSHPATVALRSQIDAATARAQRWVQGMQGRDGGWGAFDADNTRSLVRELPFLDFGEVIDEPSADVSAHALEMLAALGLLDTPAARRGVRWLIAQQEPDGSWFGRWGVNHVYGTGAAVPALIAAGVDPSQGCIRRAIRWLEEHQNEDGGWGEDPRSYDDPAWVGRGPSTASQTAWALLALHAAGQAVASVQSDGDGAGASAQPDGDGDGAGAGASALARGVEWLTANQREDGTWDEPQYTGTGFPSDYYINYHLYRLVFPIMALGRCLADPAG